MKQLSFIISISILVWSCSENKSKDEIISSPKAEKAIVKIDTNSTKSISELELEKIDSANQKVITNTPCVELQEFVIDMEKLNWVSDTNRLNKVGIYGELNRKEIKFFNKRPFYKINFENSRLNKAYNSGLYKSFFDSLEFELFEGVENIWGYFYRDKEASDWISDGVIEQWEFKSEQQAEKALRQIREPGFIIYFNTNPFYCRIRNKLIIFQTRAMKFSLDDQKPLFEKFVTEKVVNKAGITKKVTN